MKKLVLIAAMLMFFGVAMQAQANDLIDRGGGLIYDPYLNITWLKDSDYAKTSGFDADGLMTLANAKTWADGLVYHDSVRNVDYDDWRLPTAMNHVDESGPCMGGNCIDTEMGHVYYTDLLNAYGSSNILKVGPFTNLRPVDYGFNGRTVKDYFWTSSMGYVPSTGAMYPLAFGFGGGYETAGLSALVNFNSIDSYHAWAVRDGDVASAPPPDPPPTNGVPEPATMLLLGLGLIGVAGIRRRMKM